MTLVEDASRVSITADIATDGATANVAVNCEINGGSESCTEVISASALSVTTQILITGTAFFTGVPIGPSAAPSSASEATVTVTQAPSTTSASAAIGAKGFQIHLGTFAFSTFMLLAFLYAY